MKIWSNSVDENNHLKDEFGANTNNPKHLDEKGINRRSFHIGWKDLPHNTKSLAIVFEDFDAIPVCGFSWIHWLVAGIDPKEIIELEENDSINKQHKLIQGKNSWVSGFMDDNSRSQTPLYGGCAPPDKDHKYTLRVYALDKKLNMNNGFLLNELKDEIKDSVLDIAEIELKYKKIK